MRIDICAVILRSFCAPFLKELETYPTPEEKLEAVRNTASDQGNDEMVEILDWIEAKGLVETFFPA